MANDPLQQRLEDQHYTAIEDDPHAPVRVWHQPSPKAGFFGADPMHSVAVLDLLCDSPSRFVDLALEAGRAVDQMVVGGRVGEVTDHPVLQSMAGMISPGRKKNKLRKHPPHRILVVMETSILPEWAQAVIDGTLSAYPKRTVICVLRDVETRELVMPAVTSEKLQPIFDWAQELLAADA